MAFPTGAIFLVLPQFLKSVRWASIPSSFEAGSKQDPGRHRRTLHTAAESKAWLKGACSTLNLTLAIYLLTRHSVPEWVRKGMPQRPLYCVSLPDYFSEGRCSHRDPRLALYWRSDCIRDFLGNLLSSRLAGPSLHPPTPPHGAGQWAPP